MKRPIAQAVDAVDDGDEAVLARVGHVPAPLVFANGGVVVTDVVLGRGRILVKADRAGSRIVVGRADLHGVERQIAVLAPARPPVFHKDVHHRLVVVHARRVGVRAALVPENGAELRAENRGQHDVPASGVRGNRLEAACHDGRRPYPMADVRSAVRGVDDADRDVLTLLRVRPAEIVGEVERDAADVVLVAGCPAHRRGSPVEAFAAVSDVDVDFLERGQVEELLPGRRILVAFRDSDEPDAVVVAAEVLDRLRLVEVAVLEAAVHVTLSAREEDVADEDVGKRDGLVRVVGDRQDLRRGRDRERLRERRLPEAVGSGRGVRGLPGERDGHAAACRVLAPDGDLLSALENHVVLPVGGNREISRRRKARRQSAERHHQHCLELHALSFFHVCDRCITSVAKIIHPTSLH